MQMLRSFFFIVLLISNASVFGGSGYGQNKPCDSIARTVSQDTVGNTAKATQLFEDSFTDLYVNGQCDANVARLLGRFQKEGVDISSGRVFYLSSPNGFYVKDARSPFHSGWKYHAVLELNGKIYDFDFTTAAKVISTKDYFEENVLPSNAKTDPAYRAKFLAFQSSLELPAEEFLKHFPANRQDRSQETAFQNWRQNFEWKQLGELYK